MRAFRLTIPIVLFAAIMVGCIVQADTYSDQNPFSAPDTMQSSNNSTLPTATATSDDETAPAPTATPDEGTTPAPTPTPDKEDYVPTATPEYPPPSKDKDW
ncbi:MAG: hypothetical protein OXI80_18915 [Caldilineaceae bacterium]|nr:hypothetical protein [Caldilineaceae bacterium]MDE0339752.1 hypothetical protein [Caldilineaceae bacterium]